MSGEGYVRARLAVHRRLTEPALGIEVLPPLDGVVLSHPHSDHWDRRIRRGLDRSLRVVTTPHAARRLHVLHGFRQAAGLRTWQDRVLRRGGVQVRITSLPGRHAGQAVLRGCCPR